MVGWASISLEDDTFKVCEVVIYAPRFLLLQRLLDPLAGCRKQEGQLCPLFSDNFFGPNSRAATERVCGKVGELPGSLVD